MQKKYAFKVYYVGKHYTGFQKQPNGLGVENFIENAYIESGYIVSFLENSYLGTSRTDVGVNALSNIFTLELHKEPNLSQINDFLPNDNSIIIWSFALVEDNFNPRYANHKTYMYLLINPSNKIIEHFERIKLFEGSHDYSNLIKKDGAGKEDPVSKITCISYEKINTNLLVSITGDNFGREQIRKMIGFLTDEKLLSISPSHLFEGFNNIKNIKSAPPQYLYLSQIEYDVRINWQMNETINMKFELINLSLKNKLEEIKYHSNLIDKFVKI